MKLNNMNDIVDNHFEQYINTLNADEKIKEAMKYTFLNGGKRLRFKLFEALVEDLKMPSEDYVNIGIAIEMIHTYSLIHDDLPAMDNDDVRRGKPSNHIVFGEDLAILAGDALLTHAFDLIVLCDLKAEIKVELIKRFTLFAGVNKGMINGQVLDIQNENNVEITLSELENIHIQKTAKLINLCFSSALIIAEKLEFEKEFNVLSTDLGLFYQIQDDYLDAYSSSEILGKNVNSDIENGKKTYVDFFSKAGLEQLIMKKKNILLQKTKDYSKVNDVVSIIVNREV
ncbi:MAG: polyprenyl synthetase family protein [Bacilli bacterium]